MKQRRLLIKASLFSTIMVLTIRWILTLDTQRIINVIYHPPNPIPVRKSVTLNDSTYIYHLNLTSFEAEFPQLQSYICTLIQQPHPQEQGVTNQKQLILGVKSYPGKSTRRAALRQTWAKKRDINGYRLRPLFLLGKTDIKGHMEIVKLESQVYGDILQWDMAEGHHNLSLKERCFLEWLYLKSPNVDFIFKGDDDEFVNTDVIVQYIKEHGTPNTIHGAHQHRPQVMRSSKYSITRTLYPQEHYPGFVAGGGFLFPGASVKSLYTASQILPVFPLDDVYFGFLALAANLTYRHDGRFYMYGLKYDACKYKQALVVHGIDSENIVPIWREVQNSKCQKNQSAPN
ncbi:beta-1,3-galactosyltransferase 5-like [Aquarana catesbeiana]|uniref:beta-1,3-galactosyltransferase 5-like n=1 Tax=Aquarana catesbeiana TaxID=8400 RepID=UPI003CC9A2D1